MKCPFCHYLESKVLDSRPTEEGNAIRRRRECLKCFRRFTTYEKVEEIPLLVVKRDGRRVPFDRSKILSGLLKACEKRSVSLKTLEDVAEDIERDLRNSMEKEIPSTVIGEKVMERLKGIDEVAYVRFASVYRKFTDISRFRDELEKLLKER